MSTSSPAKKPIIKTVSPPHALGEGPHWDIKSQSLYYVDINGQKVHRLDPKTGTIYTAHFNYGPISVVVPIKDKIDQLIVGAGKDVLLVTWNGQENVTDPPHKVLAELDKLQDGTRSNDGKCDRRGRLWIGTMAVERDGVIENDKGTFYRVDNDLRVEKILSPVSISNGLAWSSDNRAFYYIDSPTKVVFGFDYDINTGNATNKRVIFDFKDNDIGGVPDGMTIDANDNLWVAVHNAALVLNIDPKTSKLIRKFELPANKLTSVAFGGPNLDVLYVTSAYSGLSALERQDKPDSGAVFVIEGLGVRGVPADDCVIKM